MRLVATHASSSTASDLAGAARFRSLLVPIDLSPCSDRVLGRVSRLPLASNAVVTILHVVPESLSPRQQQAGARDAKRALAVEARHLGKSLPKGVSINALVVRGSAVKEIAACATKVKAELVVMGRGGGRALRDAFLGSTAERVIRMARLAVLVVRLAPRTAYVRPALAVDIDDQAAYDVVRHVLVLLPPPRPRVAVIHAYDFPHAGLVYPSLSGREADATKAELQRKATHDVDRLLRLALAQLNVSHADAPRWKTHVRYGSPRIVVQKAISKAETDLLVLGTRGYSGAAYAFLGTVSGDLLREAKCDVLVVPPAATRK